MNKYHTNWDQNLSNPSVLSISARDTTVCVLSTYRYPRPHGILKQGLAKLDFTSKSYLLMEEKSFPKMKWATNDSGVAKFYHFITLVVVQG